MSIKAFHLVFVSVCIAFCGAFAWWCLDQYRQVHATGHLVLGVLSLAALVALLVYGRQFLRKLKQLRSL